jgi:hypothetical protein
MSRCPDGWYLYACSGMRVCSIPCRCAFHLFLYSIIFSLKGEMPNSFLISSFLIWSNLVNTYIFYLFVVHLTTLFQQLKLCCVEWNGDKWMMNWKGCGRKRSLHNLRKYLGIYLGRLSKTTEDFSQDTRFPDRYLNPDLPNTKQECQSFKHVR